MTQSATTRGYLFHLQAEGAPPAPTPYGTAETGNSGLYDDQVNGGTDNSTTQIVSGTTNSVYNGGAGALAIDPHLQAFYFADQSVFQSNGSTTNNDYPFIYGGNISTGSYNATPLYTATTGIATNDAYNYQIGDKLLINDIQVDQADGRLYFTRQYEHSNSGSGAGIQIDTPDKTYSGLYYVPEAGGAPVTVATGFSNPDAIALDVSQGFAFVTDSTGVGYSGNQTASVNRIDVVNLTTGTVSQLGISETYHPDSELGTNNYGGNVLDGVAVDPTTNTLYYTTSNEFNILTSDSYADTNYGIYSVKYTVSGGAISLVAGSTVTLYSGAGTHDPGRITIDTADGVFYVVGNTPTTTSGGTDYGVWEGNLTSVNGATLTAIDVPNVTTGSQEVFGSTTEDVPGAANLAYDEVPVVTAGGTVTYLAGGSAVAPDPGLTAASTTSVDLVNGSVAITAAQFKSTDVLAATTTGTSITASYNASTGVLGLTGADTLSHYQQVLDSVTYRSTAADPTGAGSDTSRTLTYTVFDGIATDAPGITSTVNIEEAPIVTAGSPGATYTGGGGAVAVDAVLTVADYTAANLTNATVKLTTGLLTGDTLNFTNQSGITGTYTAASGALALSGSATVAQYQAAIRSVTYSFAGNGNPTAGGETSRGLTYTATDSNGLASNTGASTLTVMHGAPSVTAGATVTFTRGSTAVTVDPGLTLTAPDSGGNLASATISITSGLATGDTLNFTSQNGITETSYANGVLSLTGTATAANYRAALESITFSTGNSATTGGRTLSYTVNDGTANSPTATSTVSVATPTPTITGAVAGQTVNDNSTTQPFAALTVGDAVGESITATTITMTVGGTASDADGVLTGTGLTKTGTGTYTLAAATPSALTTELDALTFTPTRHQVAAGSTVTTGFTVGVTDTGGGTASNAVTTVIAKAAADTPSITGAHGPTTTTDLAPVQPFTGVGIVEPDYNAMPTVTVEVRSASADTDANGTLSGTGLTKTGTGTYALAAASPTALTNEIDALTFSPTHDQVAIGQTVTTTFEITAAFSGLTAMDGVTSVQATDVPCYCPGTLILTDRGERPVETLFIGDIVITASGQHRPIKWIGHRSYVGRFLAANPGVQPIRFAAGSLGDGLPRRDLIVSPEHAMLLDGLLVPARCLTNGNAIAQQQRLGRVDYFHVELDTHDVLLAEGTPSESFVDDDSRFMFHNAHEFAALHPEAGNSEGYCAPRVEQGFALEAIRRRLSLVAEVLKTAA